MVFGILRLINFGPRRRDDDRGLLAVFCIGGRAAPGAAIPIMVVGTVIVGLLMERIAYRPLRGDRRAMRADLVRRRARSCRTARC